jgi:hypothetical protein
MEQGLATKVECRAADRENDENDERRESRKRWGFTPSRKEFAAKCQSIWSPPANRERQTSIRKESICLGITATPKILCERRQPVFHGNLGNLGEKPVGQPVVLGFAPNQGANFLFGSRKSFRNFVDEFEFRVG